MQKGNVLVIGNSGAGKSTLINAVFGEERAQANWGITGTTGALNLYEGEKIPFRLIDTIGFEPSFFKRQKAIQAVKKWSKDSTKEGGGDGQINAIWFCVEGTSRKLFPEAIKHLVSATSMWKSVPIIVVITKSYSVPERTQNIQMVKEAFAKQKRRGNLRYIIPVVAATYSLNETAYAPPEGITELIEATNAVLPEGLQAAESDMYSFVLARKRSLAHGVVAAATASGTAVGAIPIPVADGLILAPLEVGVINAVAKIYGIGQDDKSKIFFDAIKEVGTVSVAAKTAISALKAIPGINLGASVLNAIIAGSFVAAIGEGAIYAFEQVYLGKKTLDDVDWVKKLIESKLSTGFVNKVTTVIDSVSKGGGGKDMAKLIFGLFKGVN
ncbi:uncharacterized protein (DUF697 family)/GTPase SAR1 family protein [Lachnospiraceae bacterium PM6-15]|uniref:GTPase n=1 Tax=Ohessyouella blattaphilus TaxID=2949333 RepID=UPI003E20A22D